MTKEARKSLEAQKEQHQSGDYLSDIVFAANDGIVTTFTVVAGVMGAGLPALVVVILGIVSLVGDGLSMGFGNYLGVKSRREFEGGQRAREELEIEEDPDEEVAEVRDIFQKWGFKDQKLDDATATIVSDKKRWVDFMMVNELGIAEEGADTPAHHGFVTFVSFVLAGAVPLLPFFVVSGTQAAPWSVLASAITLFAIGASRAAIIPARWYRAGMEMLVVGSIAGGAAYALGWVLRNLFDVAL